MIEKWKQGTVKKQCLFTLETGVLVATFERVEDAARAMAAINQQTEKYDADAEKGHER